MFMLFIGILYLSLCNFLRLIKHHEDDSFHKFELIKKCGKNIVKNPRKHDKKSGKYHISHVVNYL